mmetsp:Transcript_4595/g.9039  ORF Transcript_4595/g.9039 Transcript_4595/m.9039 type:complete len:198 (-) Transcript_4595:97-690(-)
MVASSKKSHKKAAEIRAACESSHHLRELRLPFALAAQAGGVASDRINMVLDYLLLTVTRCQNSELGQGVRNSLRSVSRQVHRTLRPITSPLRPVADLARPLIRPALFLALVVCLGLLLGLVVLTAPLWIVVGMLTWLIWVPLGVVAAVLGCMGAVVVCVRVCTRSPRVRIQAHQLWQSAAQSPIGDLILFKAPQAQF